MGKKKNKLDPIAKLLMGIRKEKKSAKLKEKEIVFDHWHKKGQRLRIRHVKGAEETLFRCKDCHGKIDIAPVVDKSGDEIANDIKGIFKAGINYCEIGKLTLNPKYDEDQKKLLAKCEKYMYRTMKFLKIALADSFDPNKSKKKGKKGKKGKQHYSFNLSGGGASIGRRR